MYCKSKKKITALLLAGSMICGIAVPAIDAQAVYINTTRDTGLPEEAIEIVEQSVEDYDPILLTL